MNIIECPHCRKQLSVKLSVASGPRSSAPGADSGDVGELLGRINVDDLSETELKFVEETKERYEKYKDRIKVTEKQMKWLRDIAERGF